MCQTKEGTGLYGMSSHDGEQDIPSILLGQSDEFNWAKKFDPSHFGGSSQENFPWKKLF